jgi:FkbM family methyltransferase
MHARGDIANDYGANGEEMIQECAVRAALSRAPRALICLDVGANVGAWSLGLLKKCAELGLQDVRLHAFEPAPAAAEVLSAALMHHPCVRCERLAMSSASGNDFMFVTGDTAGSNSLHGAFEATGRRIPIEKTTIAAYCVAHGIAEIDLVKCDTEGHDMEVIEGAMPMLREGRIAILQFEYNHRWIGSRHFLKDAFERAGDLGYAIGKVGPRHVEVYERWHPEHERFFEGNYVLVRKDAASWLPVRHIVLDGSNSFAARETRA